MESDIVFPTSRVCNHRIHAVFSRKERRASMETSNMKKAKDGNYRLIGLIGRIKCSLSYNFNLFSSTLPALSSRTYMEGVFE